MRDSHGKASRPAVVALLAVVALVLSATGLTPTASATLPQSPVLILERTVGTRPFAGSGVSTIDSEGSAYVPRDGSLWLADDDGQAVYEVDAGTGALKRRISGFARAEELGGGPRAGASRAAEIQALAYDPTRDTLYAYSGPCCPSAIKSTAFRLTRKDGLLVLDSFQPLAPGVQVEGAAWNPCDGRVYVGSHGRLWSHDYTTNALGEERLGAGAITDLYGMDFSDDGKDLFVAQPYTRVTRVDWATRTVVPGWDLNLAGFGAEDVRSVEVIGDRLWVSDGSDKRAPGDALDHAVFVFGVGASGAVSRTPTGNRKNLVGNAGFERDVCGWDTAAARSTVTLTRVADGHSGSGAARVRRSHGKGDLRLAAVPTWEVKKWNRTYKASLWVRSAKPGDKLQLRLRELYAGRYVVDKSVTRVPLTGKWQRVTVSLDAGKPGRRIAFDTLIKNARKGTSFIADEARLRVS
jgi:DNA-binding beta-propeller fold protein YncE